MDTKDVSAQVHVQDQRGRTSQSGRTWRQGDYTHCRPRFPSHRPRTNSRRQSSVALSPSDALDAVYAMLDRLPAHPLRAHQATDHVVDFGLVLGSPLPCHLPNAQTRPVGNDSAACSIWQARPTRFGLHLDLETFARLELVEDRRTASSRHSRPRAPKLSSQSFSPRCHHATARRQKRMAIRHVN